MKRLRNIILGLGLLSSSCTFDYRLDSNEGGIMEDIKKNCRTVDAGDYETPVVDGNLSDFGIKDRDLYTRVNIDEGIRDLGPRDLTARLNCETKDIDGICLYRFFTYELHCWDASPSEAGYGRRITDYVFISSIPGIEDLYGSSKAPILCGVAIEAGVYESYLEVWDDLGDDNYVTARNIILDR